MVGEAADVAGRVDGIARSVGRRGHSDHNHKKGNRKGPIEPVHFRCVASFGKEKDYKYEHECAYCLRDEISAQILYSGMVENTPSLVSLLSVMSKWSL